MEDENARKTAIKRVKRGLDDENVTKNDKTSLENVRNSTIGKKVDEMNVEKRILRLPHGSENALRL